LNGTSQLVQPEGSILEKNSAGFLEIDQQGTANSYNYNYWTSPVSNVTPSRINSGYSLATVLYNGSKPFTFNSGFSAADNPTEVLLSSYWLYSFSGNANDYFTWRKFDENSILDPGIGFSMKGTSGAAELSKTQTYTFRGLPNNGDITVDVGANQNLLTGNPYPSAIDSEKFIDDNAIQSQNFNGSLYFWDHFSKEDTHYLYLDGTIDLNGTSQLVQPEGSILEKNSAGFLEIDQQGTANSYNYNYWTSPVSNVTPSRINSGYSLATVLYNGSKPFTFNSGFSAADNPTEVLLSSYWLYSFSGNANDYFTWRKFDENSILDPGIGFSMKGTSGAAELSKTQTYTFRGLPNNGDITVDVGANQNLLTGNPYPSAIDSEKFIDDNAIQSQNFNGSLYFWDHFSKEDTHYLEEYVGGYAVLNKSGSVSSASSVDPRINTDTDSKGTKRPGRYIPVGQGFFISTTRVNNPDAIKFQNSQRVYVKEETGSSVFHIQENIPSKNNDKDYQYSKENRQKIRLKLKSPKGYRRQILVTADMNTTTGFDIGYDAPLLDNNLEDLYWIIDETRFVIQGVPDFNKDRVLPIGFKIAEPGEYIMEVEELENIDDNFEIYLYDTFTDEYFDLIKSNHTVQTDTTGTFNTKYQLVFQKKITEEVEETEEEEEIIGELPIIEEQKDPEFLDMRYLGQTDEIALYNPNLQNIDLLEIYSVSGQKIMTFDDVPTEVSVNLRIQQKLSSAVYVVKIYVGEKSYTKKVIITK